MGQEALTGMIDPRRFCSIEVGFRLIIHNK